MVRSSTAKPAMGDVTTPTIDEPARAVFHTVIVPFAVILRVSCGVAGGLAAFAVLGPPVRPHILTLTIGILTAWSAIFGWEAMRRRTLPAPLIAVDLGLTIGVCLLIRHLVPPEALSGEVSWIAILASTSVIVAQLAWPARASVPAGLVVAAAYAVGALSAGDPQEATLHTVTLTIQTGCAAALIALVRRAGQAADVALDALNSIRAQAVLSRTRRDEERRNNRELHDTALSTLTMVGLGAIPVGSDVVRLRAASDLVSLEELSDRTSAADAGTARLDTLLADAVRHVPEVLVRLALDPCEVPQLVGGGMRDSAAEALRNIARHAGTTDADLRLHLAADVVHVEIEDNGSGFDPTAVPAHRFGLRESIHARMAAIGGHAEVISAPGQGTRIRLRWPATPLPQDPAVPA
jgi:signal transduction histidine kinase